MQSFVKTSLIGAVAAVCLTSSTGARSDDSHLVEVDVHEGHTSSVNTSAAVGADLHEECYLKDPECPPGAYKGHSRINGDYCQCHGKVAMIPDLSDIEIDSQKRGLASLADQAKAGAALAHAKARCLVTNDFQNYWFKLKDGRVPEQNSMCVCSGISGSECLSTTVALHVTAGRPVQSKLTCDEQVVQSQAISGLPIKLKSCKIDEGNFCRYRPDSNDCVTDTTCGVISQRCVDRSTSTMESEIKQILASSINGDLKGMADIAMIVGQLASKSAQANEFDAEVWKGHVAKQKEQAEWLANA